MVSSTSATSPYRGDRFLHFPGTRCALKEKEKNRSEKKPLLHFLLSSSIFRTVLDS